MRKDLKSEKPEITYNKPTIKVIGLGGGGSNAVDRILRLGYAIPDVEFIAANTDLQSLERVMADTKLLMGPALTGGMGCGGRPEVGEEAALESESLLRDALDGADIVFLTAGMGGGTGSGSIGVAARVAHELGAITISIVNTPFSFEAGKRITNARNYLTKLAAHSDTLITIPNDQLLKVANRETTIGNAFAYADDVLRQGIVGIARLLTDTGEINVDFSYVRELMQNGGGSILSIGYGKGPDKVASALYQALNHPLLEHLPIENATGIIANFTGDENLSFGEVMSGLGYLQQLANNRADIIPGQIIDPNMHDEVQIILIITGIASIPVESVNRKESNITTDTVVIRTRNEPQVEPEPPAEPVNEQMPADRAGSQPQAELSESSLPTEEVPAMAYTGPVEAEMGAEADASAIVDQPDFITRSQTQRRIYPTVEPPTYKASDAGEAAFDTFMSPLGLSGIGPAPSKISGERFNREAQNDLDVPTFIRRKL